MPVPGSHQETLAICGGAPAVEIPPPHFEWPMLGPEESDAVLQQLRSRELSYCRRGGVVQDFEDRFAALHNARFVISTNSGTAALHAAYFGLGLEPGDEVIAPAYTHLATVMPMLHANLVPVLCDIDEATGNIDPVDIERQITPRTRAVVVTHQYGHICAMEAILDLARRQNLFVIEDCSHAHGATRNNQLAGTFGDVACFSLQSNKTIVAGEGGILITNEPRIFERAALLGHFRQRWPATDERYAAFVETGYGLKNRLHPLAAAIALVQLEKMPAVIAQRKQNLDYFASQLQDIPGLKPLPTDPEVDRGGYFRFILKYHPDELGGLPIDRYLEALRMEGVYEVMAGALAKPLHLTRFFQTLDDGMYPNGWPRKGPHVAQERVYKMGDFPKSERFSASTLQFPAFTAPSKHIIDAYCRAMQKLATHADSLRTFIAGRRDST